MNYWKLFHDLMNAMSPWTPAMIMELTPVQLLCLGSEKPSGGEMIRNPRQLEEAIKDGPVWDEVPA